MACKGVVFVLELGLISLKEKTAIRHRIESAGGTVNAIVGSTVRVVITTAAVRASGSYKLISAEKLGIPVFLVDELDEVLSFPPAPRTAPSGSASSSLRSSLASTSAVKTSLISWDLPSSDLSSSEQGFSSHSSVYGYTVASSSATISPSIAEDTSVSGFGDLFGSKTSSADYSALRSSSALSRTIELASSQENTAFFGELFEVDDAPPSRSSAAPASKSAAPKATSLYNASIEEEESLFGALAGIAGEFETSTVSTTYRVGVPQLATNTAEQSADSMDIFGLFEDVPTSKAPATVSAFKAAPLATTKPAPKRFIKASDSFAIKKKTGSVAPVTPSHARMAREIKYREITSKVAEPLLIAPLQISQPSFTPLGFELKPSSIAPSPAKATPVRRFGPSFDKITSDPIVFESTIGFFSTLDSRPASPGSSLRSSDTSITDLQDKETASAPESPRSFGSRDSSFHSEQSVFGNNAEKDDDEEMDGKWEDEFVEEMEGKKNGAHSQSAAPVKRLRMARIYVDRQTGEMWQRKDAKFKAPTKLVLECGKGVNRVFDSTTGLVSAHPFAKPAREPVKVKQPVVAAPSLPLSAAHPLDPTPSEASGKHPTGDDEWIKAGDSLVPFDSSAVPAPALPQRRSKVAKHVFTGVISDKFSWVDIVTGKASTTKRVPAMDGQKIFISGFKFDDILLHGKPREEQFSFYKEEDLKKVKERNSKAMRNLKKKQRKAALARATVAADGTVVHDSSLKKDVPKLSDDKQLMRMKTDEQIMNDIVQWPERRVVAAIDHRKKLIQDIFTRFGEVTHWNPDWNKGFIHVTYKSADHARTCMRALKDFETRSAVVRRLRENNPLIPKEALPSPSFYVRWTTCYQRKIDRKAEAAKQQKLAAQDAAVAKHAAAAASATSSISTTVKAKAAAKKAN